MEAATLIVDLVEEEAGEGEVTKIGLLEEEVLVIEEEVRPSSPVLVTTGPMEMMEVLTEDLETDKKAKRKILGAQTAGGQVVTITTLGEGEDVDEVDFLLLEEEVVVESLVPETVSIYICYFLIASGDRESRFGGGSRVGSDTAR